MVALGFGAIAQAQSLVLSYALDSDQNVRPLSPDGTIIFPASPVGVDVGAELQITNRGAEQGFVTGLGLTATAFRLSGVPLFPALVGPGQTLRVRVLYRARSVSLADQGTIVASFPGQANFTVNLSGIGRAAPLALSYVPAEDANVVGLLPGGTLSFRPSPIGSDVEATLQVANTGAEPAFVSAVSIAGDAFRLAGVPALPVTIPAGQTLRIPVVYRARSAGVSDTGRITLNYAGESPFFIDLTGIGRPAALTLNYVLPSDQNVVPVLPGGTVDFGEAPANGTVEAAFQITNTGTAPAIVSELAVSGSAFRFSGIPLLPTTLPAGQTLRVTLAYRPSGGAEDTGTIRAGYAGETPILLNVRGRPAAPSLTLRYSFGDQIVSIPAGGSLEFPPTAQNTTSTATLSIVNSGTSAATISGLSISGAAFSLSGLPAFPTVLAAGQGLQVQVVYFASANAEDFGLISLAYPAGELPIPLRGRRLASQLRYETQTVPPIEVLPGGTIQIPDTEVSAATRVGLLIANRGPSPVTLTTIAIEGTSYALEDLPLLPLTLTANGSVIVTVLFQPEQAGTAPGALTVNTDRLGLRALAIGPELTFSYEASGVVTPLPASGPVVVFPPVAISASSNATLVIRNRGTGVATITSLGVDQGAAAYSLQPPPALPATIPPDGTLRVPIQFAPVNLGFINGTVRINAAAISLSGSGTEPPPLPEFSFTGPTGTVAPAAQARVGLTLTQPYPVAISGTLTLEIGGDLPADPAVQFASGGRSVGFEVPANSTQALFAGQADRIGVQTGTVAGSMRIVPTFRTQAGQVNVAQTIPSTLDFSIARAAPVLQAIEAATSGGTNLTLTIAGFTTTRDLTSLILRFTPVSGAEIPNPEVRVDLRSASTLWFQRPASQSFGGQFSLTLPLTIAGSSLGSDTPVSRLESVSATMENTSGMSNSVTAAIR
jgi:hypothetical protein